MKSLTLTWCCLLAATLHAAEAPATAPAAKTASAFFPPVLLERIRTNVTRFEWASQARDEIVKAAEPWLKFTDQELWDSVYANTIKRSWMVLSNGDCPTCRKPVPMYNWKSDPILRPWKMQCPQCQELFPKNDFEKFYRSGLDEAGLFQPGRADRSLLFNADHADVADPLRTFGVDDGEGYVEGDRRWRFIGAYLIYGQWKQKIVGGCEKLAAAYIVTGDARYAHKAAVLFDRVADLYPTYDFHQQGILYEGQGVAGYISTWHDACAEIQTLALAYDRIFTALQEDTELVRFLSDQAARHHLTASKGTMADIRRNIETRILQDTLRNRPKIQSNYPTTDVAILLIETVLGWPANQERVMALMADILRQSSEVDGLSGEKGLAGYSTIAPRNVAALLGLYARANPGLLAEAIKRHPQLAATFRFHIDTWLFGEYYPNNGDCGSVARRGTSYAGIVLSRVAGLEPSGFGLLWDLYRETKDPDYVRVLYHANNAAVDGLPYDLCAQDPVAFQRDVQEVISTKGAAIRTPSVNKQQYRLAVLRSGEGNTARALVLDYDSGGKHAHADGMNIELYACGLALLPDFGYPPVHYGKGWESERARWYRLTASHNTVLVDGANLRNASGETTLWADSATLHLIRASSPAMINGRQFERTAALVDTPDGQFYALDLFRVAGGREHLKMLHGHFGTLETPGLRLKPATLAIPGAIMRGFQSDPAPPAGWQALWKIQDHHQYLPPDTRVQMRVTDLTRGAEAWTAESWVSTSLFASMDEAWLPGVMMRRHSDGDALTSTFVSTIEAFTADPPIRRVQSLPVRRPGSAAVDGDVALEVMTSSGTRDLILAADVESGGATRPAGSTIMLEQPDWKLQLDGEFALIRRHGRDPLFTIVLCRTTRLRMDTIQIELQPDTSFVEIEMDFKSARLKAGSPDAIRHIRAYGKDLWKQ